MKWLVAGLAVVASINTAPAVRAQDVRDHRVLTGVGTGTITGVVVVDDRDRRPLRRTRVTLTGTELDIGRATITGDDGTFTFTRLPAGRYLVTGAKDGYVTMSAGAERPGRPGISIEVRAGETGRTTLRLPKGAVITGMVRLPTGEPAPGINVSTLAYQYARGERILNPSAQTVTTDDRGEYRIFGLQAGTHIIRASPRTVSTEIQVLSDAEIRRALAEVKQQSVASRPGMISPPATAMRPTEPPQAAILPVAIFFPGTPNERQATPVTVAAGQVRSGIDIDLDYVRAATIEGHVSTTPGVRVQLILTNADGTTMSSPVRSATPTEDGRFTFRSLPPGHYSITARTMTASPRPGVQGENPAFGQTEVIVSGEDVSGVSIAMRPGLTMTGKVVFTGSTAAPVLPTLRVPVPASTFGAITTQPLPTVQLEGDRFSIVGAMPGRYRLQTLPVGIRTPIGPWWLQSLVVSGKDLLDSELTLRDSVEDAVITFADRASELSGTVRYQNGTPYREGLVVVFSADRTAWFYNSRRVAALQPLNGGRYVVRNLPPGDYFVTVAGGLLLNEWFDPEVLATLAETAQKVRIVGTETKTQDVILAK